MSRKETRQITGHTFADLQSNEDAWYGSAISFHEAATLLGKHEDSIQGGTRVFLTNSALSIELLLKAITVAQGRVPPMNHELPALARDAGVAFTKNQEATLELLGEILKWSGRYPVPKKEEIWDRYYDDVHEKHVIRERVGNVGITRANPETFPSIRNCEKLWDLANRKWDELHPNVPASTGETALSRSTASGTTART